MTDYPLPAFHFLVQFHFSSEPVDMHFQSVSGLTVEYGTETIVEGGENRFEHVLPVRNQYSDVSLKRPLATDSALVEWCRRAFEDRRFAPTTVTISLLDVAGEPLRNWHLNHAWPRKWTIADFSAEENSFAIETLDLAYRYFTTD